MRRHRSLIRRHTLGVHPVHAVRPIRPVLAGVPLPRVRQRDQRANPDLRWDKGVVSPGEPRTPPCCS